MKLRHHASCVVSVVAFLGCADDGSYDVLVQFSPPELGASVERIEVALVPSCDGQELGTEAEADRVVVLRRAEEPMPLGDLAPGSYGLYGRGISNECRAVAAGCAEVNLEAGGSGTLSVTLSAIDGAGCGTGEVCAGGECVTADASTLPDASSMDAATIDAGRDAGEMDAARIDAPAMDAGGMDGGPDTGPPDTGAGDACATAVETCNGVDDDCDSRVDEAPCTVGFADVSAVAGVATTPAGGTYGVSWADFDDDGFLDLWVANGDELFRNQGDGTFLRVAGPWDGAASGTRPGFWADPDNDGDLDLFIRNTDTADEMLLINGGAGSFVDRGVAANLQGINLGTVLWIDYDRDGHIDLFFPDGSTPAHDIRRNNGVVPVTFTTVPGTTIGLSAVDNGEAGAVADVDNDGDQDFWHNDGGDGSLFLSNGAGAFVESSATAGLAVAVGTDYHGISFGDFDNDGDLDVFFAHDVGNANRLYVNAGTGVFTLSTALAFDLGSSVGTDWGDYDNDGDLDLYVGNDGAPNALYRNEGGGGFTNVAGALGVLGPSTWQTSTVSFADYDNDGDLDLFAAGDDNVHRLWRNALNDTDYLKVRVVGRGAGFASRDGIGSRVELRNAAGTTLLAVREVSGGGGFGLQGPLIVHFGLADAWGGGGGTYTVRVRFADGSVMTRSAVVPTASSITIGTTTLSQTIEVRQ